MKIFWAFTRQTFHNSAVYRFEFWMRLFWVYMVMYSIYWVWKTLYTQTPGAFGVSLQQMVTYGILGMALDIFWMWVRNGTSPHRFALARSIRI
jgi:ABC-2 type transport system permease protein